MSDLDRIVMVQGDALTYEYPEAELVLTDPPWTYEAQNGKPPPYEGLSTEDIVTVLFERLRWRRLAVWVTAPLFPEFVAEIVKRGLPMFQTVGAWDKNAYRHGQGKQWGSRMEFLLLFVKPKAVNNPETPLENGYSWAPTSAGDESHSYKPPGWQSQMIRKWTAPGAVIVDPFLGLGSSGHAADMVPNRRFLGTEKDPARLARAVASLDHLRRARARRAGGTP